MAVSETNDEDNTGRFTALFTVSRTVSSRMSRIRYTCVAHYNSVIYHQFLLHGQPTSVAKQISVMDALIPNIVLGSTRKQKLQRRSIDTIDLFSISMRSDEMLQGDIR